MNSALEASMKSLTDQVDHLAALLGERTRERDALLVENAALLQKLAGRDAGARKLTPALDADRLAAIVCEVTAERDQLTLKLANARRELDDLRTELEIRKLGTSGRMEEVSAGNRPRGFRTG